MKEQSNYTFNCTLYHNHQVICIHPALICKLLRFFIKSGNKRAYTIKEIAKKINKPRGDVQLGMHVLCSNLYVMRLGERGPWMPSMSDYKDMMTKVIEELGDVR